MNDRTKPLKNPYRRGTVDWRKWEKRMGYAQESSPEMGLRRLAAVSNFWPRVDKNGDGGCWLWRGALDDKGYGRIKIAKGMRLAHRISWLLKKGPIGDLNVLHKCDNPACVNPDHLFLGTHSDNMKDCWAKGRMDLPWRENTNPRKDSVAETEGFEPSVRCRTVQRFSNSPPHQHRAAGTARNAGGSTP